MAASETVRVIVRCRPMNQREIDLKCQVRSNQFEEGIDWKSLDDCFNESTRKPSDARKCRANK